MHSLHRPWLVHPLLQPDRQMQLPVNVDVPRLLHVMLLLYSHLGPEKPSVHSLVGIDVGWCEAGLRVGLPCVGALETGEAVGHDVVPVGDAVGGANRQCLFTFGCAPGRGRNPSAQV